MSFFHLPNQDYVRTQTDYTEIFALTLLWNVGLLGMLIAFLFVVFLALKMYQLKIQNQSKSKLRDSLLTNESRQQSQRMSQQRSSNQIITNKSNNQSSQSGMQIQEKEKQEVIIQKLMQNPNNQMFKIINFLTSFFFYFLWVCIALIYLVFYMFGYFGRGLSHDILAVFIMTILVAIPTLIWKSQTKVKNFKQIKKQVIFTTVCMFLWLGISIFAIISLKGACLCYYNDNYGIKMSTDLFLSTQWTRTNSISKICGDNQICNLYATVPQDTSTAVFINLHSGTNLQNITLRMTSPTGTILEKISAKPIKLLNVQQIGKRYVHSILFTGLEQNTMYKLQIVKNDGKTIIKSTRYKTVPDYNSQTVKMAVGGDVSMTKQGELITSYLVNYNPDIIIIGGDIAYDDGMRTCYYSWDNFYNIFQTLNNKLQRLVPMILTIGNHDVGFDAFSLAGVSKQFQDIPLFFLYNPQHFSMLNPNEVPAINQRSSIHHHIIGPSVHLHLDSGYISTYESQVTNIEFIGEKYKHFYLFANYHNPLYPSCTNSDQNSNDRLVIDKGTRLWTPKFDYYGFVAGFQHHTHHKKFTKKMKNNTVSTTNGMRFVGDGSWGVKQGPCPQTKITKKKQMFEFFDSKEPNHIWQITLSKVQNQKFYQINYTVINMKGQKDHPEQVDNLTQFSPTFFNVNQHEQEIIHQQL